MLVRINFGNTDIGIIRY